MFCHACGAECHDSNRFCAKCGYLFNAAPTPTSMNSEPKPATAKNRFDANNLTGRQAFLIVLGIVAFLIVCGLLTDTATRTAGNQQAAPVQPTVNPDDFKAPEARRLFAITENRQFSKNSSTACAVARTRGFQDAYLEFDFSNCEDGINFAAYGSGMFERLVMMTQPPKTGPRKM